jgi:hypothetical protein
MLNVVGVVDALQRFGGFFNQPKGSFMKKVLATLIASFVAASVFAASPNPAPSATAAAETAKPAAVTKKHKASKEGKQKIAPAAPASAAVK